MSNDNEFDRNYPPAPMPEPNTPVQPVLQTSKKNQLAGLKTTFITLQIILVVIQIIILLLLLAPHGHVYNSNNAQLNGYEMGRIAYPVSAAIFIALSIASIYLAIKNKRSHSSYTVQYAIQFCCAISHPILLFFVLSDSFKHICIDTCGKYVADGTGAGWAMFGLYLAEFWLIVASLILVNKTIRVMAQIESSKTRRQK